MKTSDLGEGYKKNEVDSRIETGRLSRERESLRKLQLQREIEERQRIAESQEKQQLQELAQEREAIQRTKAAEEQVKKEKQKEQFRIVPMFPKRNGRMGR